MPPERLHQRLSCQPETARKAIGEAAEAWHGHWNPEDGSVDFFVRAGLRTGRFRGTLDVAGDDRATHLTLHPAEVAYRLDGGRVALLSLAGAAALPIILWPFFPALLRLVPIALVLAVGGWFLVVSGLQNQGPEEFLATVSQLVDGPDGK